MRRKIASGRNEKWQPVWIIETIEFFLRYNCFFCESLVTAVPTVIEDERTIENLVYNGIINRRVTRTATGAHERIGIDINLVLVVNIVRSLRACSNNLRILQVQVIVLV